MGCVAFQSPCTRMKLMRIRLCVNLCLLIRCYRRRYFQHISPVHGLKGPYLETTVIIKICGLTDTPSQLRIPSVVRTHKSCHNNTHVGTVSVLFVSVT